jgi:hypothetical protein
VRRLNQGQYKAVPAELMRWVNSGGSPLPGLVRRRKAEGVLFSQGSYSVVDARIGADISESEYAIVDPPADSDIGKSNETTEASAVEKPNADQIENQGGCSTLGHPVVQRCQGHKVLCAMATC